MFGEVNPGRVHRHHSGNRLSLASRALLFCLPSLCLAFIRYLFAPKFPCTIQSSLYCPLHLHCSHYCNTISRRMRNIRPTPYPPVRVQHTIQYW